MIVGELAASGIRANCLPPLAEYRRGKGGADIYVRAEDLARASEVVDAPALSEDELIEAEEDAAARHLLLSSARDAAPVGETKDSEAVEITPSTPANEPSDPREPAVVPTAKRGLWDRILGRSSTRTDAFGNPKP